MLKSSVRNSGAHTVRMLWRSLDLPQQRGAALRSANLMERSRCNSVRGQEVSNYFTPRDGTGRSGQYSPG